MTTMYFIVGILIIAVILLAVIMFLLYRINKILRQNPEQVALQRAVTDGINSILHDHKEDLSALYAEDRLAKRINSRINSDNIDLAALAKDANKRVLALSIQYAENEATRTADDLARIENKISHVEKERAFHTAMQMSAQATKDDMALRALLAQAEEVKKHLEKAKANLAKLTESVGQLHLDSADADESSTSDDDEPAHPNRCGIATKYTVVGK